jgi:hypothetical protein
MVNSGFHTAADEVAGGNRGDQRAFLLIEISYLKNNGLFSRCVMNLVPINTPIRFISILFISTAPAYVD